MKPDLLLVLLITAGTTYLLRALPLALMTKKITHPFTRAFLTYTPYAVLAAMTVPAIFEATPSLLSAGIGFAVAVLLALFKRNMITVALGASASVFLVEWLATIL